MEMRCRLHMHLRAAWTGFHVLDSGWGITMEYYTWALDFGLFWILADVPSCHQKVAAFELAFHLRCLVG